MAMKISGVLSKILQVLRRSEPLYQGNVEMDSIYLCEV